MFSSTGENFYYELSPAHKSMRYNVDLEKIQL